MLFLLFIMLFLLLLLLLFVCIVMSVIMVNFWWRNGDLKWEGFVFLPLQWVCFGHNSFGFEAKIMGLDVLESSFYDLSLWRFEFLHLRCRDFMKLTGVQLFFLGLRYGGAVLVCCFEKFREGFWK